MNDWKAVVDRALAVENTPLFVFSWPHVLSAIGELEQAACVAPGLPVRHWLSFKTQPLRALLQAWRRTGAGVEVVSEFEYRAARAEGFGVDEVLVNGVAKHRWLSGYSESGLRVQFDSLLEIERLRDLAARDEWRVGLRVHVSQERNSDEPQYGTQFGLNREDFGVARDRLREVGVHVEGLHFHLGSNVERPELFADAIRELHALCRQADLQPRYLDCGGGIPAPGEKTLTGQERQFDLRKFFELVANACDEFEALEEVWLENGRYVTSRAGVLVVTVLDRKMREGICYLVCDGGRTNHALVSDWEQHRVEVHPMRDGSDGHVSTICGPTCMAYDWLCRVELACTAEIGDRVVWHNAGAYHLPWETRFSHGAAPVVWCGDEGQAEVVRQREGFEGWWKGLGGQGAG